MATASRVLPIRGVVDTALAAIAGPAAAVAAAHAGPIMKIIISGHATTTARIHRLETGTPNTTAPPTRSAAARTYIDR